MVSHQIEEVLGFAKVKPACLQVESHPFLTNLDLLDFCKKHDIAFVSYSPLGTGERVRERVRERERKRESERRERERERE